MTMDLRAFLLDSAAIAKIAFRRYFAPLTLSMGGYRSYFSTGVRASGITQNDRPDMPSATLDDVGLKKVSNIPIAVQADVDLAIDDQTAALSNIEESIISIDMEHVSEELLEARTMTEIGTKLDLAREYVDQGDPAGARSILEEVLDEGDEENKKLARKLLSNILS